jgi:uncharacterized OB-fold protein
MEQAAATAELTPVREGLYAGEARLGAPVRLRGARCTACGALFFPQRALCARCSSAEFEETLFGPDGLLYSFTVLPDAPGDDPDGGAYIVGQVTFPEGIRVQGRLRGCAPERIALDQPFTAVWGAIGAEGDHTVVAHVFVPGGAS